MTMNKSANFSGQPIFKQILRFVDRDLVYRTAQKHDSDRYYKTFKTYDHLVTMLFASISGVSSLRELSGVMLACQGKINHLDLDRFPRRSTVSDANRNRNSAVFSDIYHGLLRRYRGLLSDSMGKCPPVKDLQIIDATTISLLSDILKGAGRNPINGKKKGGIKMHTMINAMEDVPCLVRFSSAATHDTVFLKDLELKKGSFVVFDKGYNDYGQYAKWDLDGVFFVTRQKTNAVYTSLEEFDIADDIDPGVLRDERISVEKKDGTKVEMRRVAYWHAPQNKVFEFITNNFEIEADTVAQIYRRRWQIETMFKRLKQNFPLKYFLGDTRNAIEIQIWVSLIIQLIMLVIQRMAKRKWAFSNMVSIIRYHLMNYIDLFKFLKEPDLSYEKLTTKPPPQLALF